jgi:hypothetical protein
MYCLGIIAQKKENKKKKKKRKRPCAPGTYICRGKKKYWVRIEYLKGFFPFSEHFTRISLRISLLRRKEASPKGENQHENCL